MKKYGLFTFLLITSYTLRGQDTMTYAWDVLFLKNHFSLHAKLPFSSFSSTKISGKGDMQTFTGLGFAFGFSGLMNVGKNFALEGGINFGLQSYGFRMEANEKEFNIPFVIDHKQLIREFFIRSILS